MFVFGHVGLTWGSAVLLAVSSRRLPFGRRRPLAGIASALDYRSVVAGSMLPDVIDKPLGVFVLSDEVSTGRAFAHGLAFAAAIVVLALLSRGEARRILACLAFGAAAHLAFDRMWLLPETLLWPLLGWQLERENVSGWIEQMLELLASDPYTYISEAAGALVTVTLLAYLVVSGGVREFILSGRMEGPPAGWWKGGLGAGQESAQQLERRQRVAHREPHERPERRQRPH